MAYNSILASKMHVLVLEDEKGFGGAVITICSSTSYSSKSRSHLARLDHLLKEVQELLLFIAHDMHTAIMYVRDNKFGLLHMLTRL